MDKKELLRLAKESLTTEYFPLQNTLKQPELCIPHHAAPTHTPLQTQPTLTHAEPAKIPIKPSKELLNIIAKRTALDTKHHYKQIKLNASRLVGVGTFVQHSTTKINRHSNLDMYQAGSLIENSERFASAIKSKCIDMHTKVMQGRIYSKKRNSKRR